ncbi:MAG: UbiA family prenyltransferase [Snodgrassella sp.]|nr:UbiA family prenyltransferase [Snodgrassella sp.]
MNKSCHPLIVDLDGTLILTDSLHETLIVLIKTQPFAIFKLLKAYLQGKAAFKKYVYEQVGYDVEQMPYRHELVEYIKQEREHGRKVFLATAAYKGIAVKTAEYLQCFDGVIATDNKHNLKGIHKLKAIQQNFGQDFIYAGDSSADLVIWQNSCGAIVVGNKVKKLAQKLEQSNIPVVKQWDNSAFSLVVWMKAIRLHQWLKNILLFVPLLIAFQFYDFPNLFLTFIAFISFSLGASATYILNDLWDLQNDRAHNNKKFRPFAAGKLSIAQGITASSLLLMSACLIAIYVSWFFLGIFLLYLLITTLYSFRLKQVILMDIIVLSVLYTIRIIAGGIVTSISLSYSLLAFSVLIFLSLATVKRCAELVAMPDEVITITGRGYIKSDLDVLWPLGVSTYIGAIIVFGLYINAPDTIIHYSKPALLWIVQLFLIYLIGNLWMVTRRGLMHDDPIIYFIQDKKSLIILALITFVISIARFL